MNNAIEDFNSSELWIIRTSLKERYNRDIELQLADSELRLDPATPALT